MTASHFPMTKKVEKLTEMAMPHVTDAQKRTGTDHVTSNGVPPTNCASKGNAMIDKIPAMYGDAAYKSCVLLTWNCLV